MTPEPGIVLKNQALKIIPLDGRIEPRSMMEDLARSHGFVAVPFEMHGKGNRIGQMREATTDRCCKFRWSRDGVPTSWPSGSGNKPGMRYGHW